MAYPTFATCSIWSDSLWWDFFAKTKLSALFSEEILEHIFVNLCFNWKKYEESLDDRVH